MLQELAARTDAVAWAIGSMLFFLTVYLVIVVRVFRARPEDLEARAHLALEGDPPSRSALRRAGPPPGSALRRAGPPPGAPHRGAGTAADGDDGPDRRER